MKINDSIPHLILKVIRRKIYPRIFTPYKLPSLNIISSLDKANEIIYQKLMSNDPCMIARYGEFELTTVINYLYITGRYPHSWIKYIKGEGWEWWWNETTLDNMKNNAGVWPNDHETISRYCQLVIDDSSIVDVIGSITGLECYLDKELKKALKVPLFNLEPFFSKCPWTKALKGKKILVVHPFANTIEKQYRENRNKIFTNPFILPEFKLVTVKAVQSIGGSDKFKDWFEALEYMKGKIDSIDYDIAILGCGAYGFNLAAHIKRSGKKAIHLGGVSQLLFGIRGKRWDNPVRQMCGNGYYPDLINEYWCRPSEEDKPTLANNVEGGCYW